MDDRYRAFIFSDPAGQVVARYLFAKNTRIVASRHRKRDLPFGGSIDIAPLNAVVGASAVASPILYKQREAQANPAPVFRLAASREETRYFHGIRTLQNAITGTNDINFSHAQTGLYFVGNDPRQAAGLPFPVDVTARNIFVPREIDNNQLRLIEFIDEAGKEIVSRVVDRHMRLTSSGTLRRSAVTEGGETLLVQNIRSQDNIEGPATPFMINRPYDTAVYELVELSDERTFTDADNMLQDAITAAGDVELAHDQTAGLYLLRRDDLDTRHQLIKVGVRVSNITKPTNG